MTITPRIVSVPAQNVQQAEDLIRRRQDQGIADGWVPEGAKPLLTTRTTGTGTVIEFEAPEQWVPDLVEQLGGISRAIKLLKDIGNGVEDIAKAVGNAVEDAATA